jgi:hypothetical protein
MTRGRIIKEIHQCVQPNLKPEWGDGTQWLCDCGQTWEIVTAFSEQVWFTDKKAHNLKINRGEIPRPKRRRGENK